MAAAARGGLKCLEVCGYCCEVLACGVETVTKIWIGFTMVCTCGQGWAGIVILFLTLANSEEDPDFKDFDLPVTVTRRFTDIPGLILFLCSLIGMMFVMNRALTYGKPGVYKNGVDSFTNICGFEENKKFSKIPNSGVNMKDYSKLLIANLLVDKDAVNLKSDSSDFLQICVSICPPSGLNFSCTKYVTKYSPYGNTLATHICGTAGHVDPPKFIDENNRCVPKHLVEDVSIQKQNSLLNLFGSNWLYNVIHDCGICAAELTWIILIALAFTGIFMVIIVAAANALCWYSFATFFIVGSVATGYMWYLYSLIKKIDTGVKVFSSDDVKNSFEASVTKAALQIWPAADVVADSSSNITGTPQTAPQAGYSIVFRDASIYSTFVVALLSIICVFIGKRNMDASAVVFEEAARSMAKLKWIYFLPITSILSLCFAFGMWMHAISYLTSIFLSEPIIQGDNSTAIIKGTYKADVNYSNWVLLFEFIGIIWMFNFILACQQMIISLAVSTWYFSIEKDEMYRPMRVALTRLVRKHLGSAMVGGFMVGYFSSFRAPLSFAQTRIISTLEQAKQNRRECGGNSDDSYSEYSGEPAPSAGRSSKRSGRPSAGSKVRTSQPGRTSKQSSRPSRRSANSGDRSTVPYRPSRGSAKSKSKSKKDADTDSVQMAKKMRKAEVGVRVWRTVHNACLPCFWFQNNVLIYISDLNYSVVALKGTWFMEGGREIRDRLEDQPRLKGIQSISSFALVLGKLTITLTMLPIGFLLIKDKTGVFMYGYPLAVMALLSYIVAHVFLSVFEAAAATVYVCYLEDTYLNDGTKRAPFYGGKSFYRDFDNALYQISPENANKYDKVHWEPENQAPSSTNLKPAKRGEVDSDETDDSSDRKVNFSRFSTKNEIRNRSSKKSKTNSVFAPMPPKKQRPPSPPQENSYDDPYSEDAYGIERLFNQARENAEDLEELERERRKRKHRKDKNRDGRKEQGRRSKHGDKQNRSSKTRRDKDESRKDHKHRHSNKHKSNPKSEQSSKNKTKGIKNPGSSKPKGQNVARSPLNKPGKMKGNNMKAAGPKGMGNAKMGKSMKMGKKFKGMKGKGFKGMDMKKMKTPKMPKGLKAPKVPKGMRARGKLGGVDVMGGVHGAMNVADGMMRIAGKKQDVEKAAQNAAFGTRKRAKATALLGHITQNRLERLSQVRKGPKLVPDFIRSFRKNKELIQGGRKILQDVDKQWDEIDAEEDEFGSS